jgi:hypothetical protein
VVCRLVRRPDAGSAPGPVAPTSATFATWLEDGGIPARVIDELMGHQAGRRGERDGSMIGTRYRHMTAEMQARMVAVIGDRLAVALAAMPQVCPKGGNGGGGGRVRAVVTGRVSCADVGVELRGFEPLTSCMPSSERRSKRSWSPSFALLIAGLELYRYGPPVTVVVPSHILQTSSKLDARPRPYQGVR